MRNCALLKRVLRNLCTACAYRGLGQQHQPEQGDASSHPDRDIYLQFKNNKLEEVVSGMKDMIEGEEETGPEINAAFAKIVNGMLRKRPGEEAVKKLLKCRPRPANVEHLVVPRTNTNVYENLQRGAAIVDGSIQRSQGLLARALSAALQLVNTIGEDSSSPLEKHLGQISDIIRGIATAFSSLSQTRKDCIRNDSGDPIAKMCTWETPVGAEWLFAGDVAKQVHDKEQARLKLRKKRFNRYVEI